MRVTLVLMLLSAASLCGCSHGTMPIGTPVLEVDGFFVCRKCACLSAINGGEPPAVIATHASVCPAHSWQRISRRDYIERASASPIAIRLVPPTRDLTISTRWGATGLILYPFGFVFRVGPSYYALSAPPAAVGGAFLVLGLLGCAGRWFWKRKRE
jgi:hypothetical protein